MFRSLRCKLGVNLKRTTPIINGESSSPSPTLLAAPAKYFLFRIQNQNVAVISNSRVTSTVYFSTTATNGNSSNSSSVVSYLINCGLSENEAISASKKLNFKTTSNPYSVLDFFKSKGIDEIELADFISSSPQLLMRDLRKEIIPCFDTLRSIVQSDENVIEMIRRNHWIISTDRVERLMVSVQHLRNIGVPETNISNHVIIHTKVYMDKRFEEIVERVREMGFNHLESTFLKAVHMLTEMSEARLRNKMDVYKRCGGWSEVQNQSAFRKCPTCIKTSEKKIMAVLNILVNEMGYDSSIVAENPIVFCCSLPKKIIPRCSVIRVLVSRGLIKENISLDTLATLVDESFLEKFVKKYEQEVPGLMKVFERQLNFQELL